MANSGINEDDITTEAVEIRTELGQLNAKAVKLLPKQKKFADAYLKHGNKAQAIRDAGYIASTLNSAQAAGTRLAQKPQVISYLEGHANLAEHVLYKTMQDWQHSDTPRKRELALDAAKYTHDKVFGKATQSVSVKSTVVNVNIDLSGE